MRCIKTVTGSSNRRKSRETFTHSRDVYLATAAIR
jgi:hypothetical protein